MAKFTKDIDALETELFVDKLGERAVNLMIKDGADTLETIPKREKSSDEDSEKDKENQQKAIKNLNTSNLRMQEMMKKVGKAVSKRVKTAPNQLLLGNGNISILTEADTKYDFYLDL